MSDLPYTKELLQTRLLRRFYLENHLTCKDCDAVVHADQRHTCSPPVKQYHQKLDQVPKFYILREGQA